MLANTWVFWQANKAFIMGQKMKHSILLFFSIVLLLATLFVPQKSDNIEQLKNVGLGYPIAFIYQDFSYADKSFSFFPCWHRLEFNNKDYPIKFKPTLFLLSLFILFIVVEFIVYLLEILDFKIRKLIYKK